MESMLQGYKQVFSPDEKGIPPIRNIPQRQRSFPGFGQIGDRFLLSLFMQEAKRLRAQIKQGAEFLAEMRPRRRLAALPATHIRSRRSKLLRELLL
jgi:hypothetical protein